MRVSWLSSSFFFRFSLVLQFLSWVRPLRWSPAGSVAEGEPSTGSLVAGELPRAATVQRPTFSPVWLSPLWFSSFLRRPVRRPALSVAAGEGLAGNRSPATFLVTGGSPELQVLACFFSAVSSEEFLGQVCSCFMLWFAGWGFFLVSAPCLLACLLRIIV